MQLAVISIVICCICSTITFGFVSNVIQSPLRLTRFELFMGRAAAVRAATKARTDGAKAKNNNRFAKAIINVVKQGGPDPDSNRALATVLADAKAANVPNDVIKRNIEKASAANTVAFKESLFEFIGPGGSYMLVNVLTDNDNRASSEVNLVGKKQSLKPGSKGSVAFNFLKKARLDISTVIEEDSLMEFCLEAGVDDYDLRTIVDGNPLNPVEEGKSSIYVELNDMSAMRDTLRSKGFTVETSIRQVPKDGFVNLSDDDFTASMNALDAFLALDDVDSVEHNINLVDEDE